MPPPFETNPDPASTVHKAWRVLGLIPQDSGRPICHRSYRRSAAISNVSLGCRWEPPPLAASQTTSLRGRPVGVAGLSNPGRPEALWKRLYSAPAKSPGTSPNHSQALYPGPSLRGLGIIRARCAPLYAAVIWGQGRLGTTATSQIGTYHQACPLCFLT